MLDDDYIEREKIALRSHIRHGLEHASDESGRHGVDMISGDVSHGLDASAWLRDRIRHA